MDKNFIKENNLNEAVKRFRQIAEYKSPRQSLKQLNEFTFITNAQVDEDDDNGDMMQPQQNNGMNQQPQNASPEQQNQDGGMNGQMGAEMQPQGTEMPQNGMQMPQDGTQMPQDGGDMSMGAEMPMDNGGMPQDDGGMGFPGVDEDGVETEEMEPEDEVIDVDELTQSQEATEYKIDGVDDRLSQIFAAVQKFSDQLEKQEAELSSLKDEFTKRNPTPEEKLNIRSQSTYPYCELPKDYWSNKAQENPNYNVMFNNEVSPSDEQNKFEIKKGDISGLDMKNISDTLNLDQKLSDYIGF